MRPNISLITLGVENIERSKKFYEEILGWKASSQSNENVVFFPLNGIVLGLFGKDALAEDAQVPAEGSGFKSVSLAHNCVSREEVDSIFAELKEKNVTIHKEPQEVFWGGYSGYFADPDGHLWEVAHNPFWPLDENGFVMLPD